MRVGVGVGVGVGMGVGMDVWAWVWMSGRVKMGCLSSTSRTRKMHAACSNRCLLQPLTTAASAPRLLDTTLHKRSRTSCLLHQHTTHYTLEALQPCRDCVQALGAACALSAHVRARTHTHTQTHTHTHTHTHQEEETDGRQQCGSWTGLCRRRQGVLFPQWLR